MKNQRERGEIATLLTVGTLVVIAVTAVTSSLFLNQKKTTGSRAAGMPPCNKCVGTVCQKAAGSCNPELDTCTTSTDCKTPTSKPTTKAAATPKPTTGGGGGLKSCGSTPSYTDASTCSTRCGGVTCDPCNNLGKTKYICPNSGSTPTCDDWNDFDLPDCEAKCGAGNCKKCADAAGNIKYQCKKAGDPNDTWTCDMYNNESSCTSNNCYWWDNTCNNKEKPKPTLTKAPNAGSECHTNPYKCSNLTQCQDTDEYPNGNSMSYYYGTGSKGGKRYDTSACLNEVINLREYCCGKEKTPSPGGGETCSSKNASSCSSGTCSDSNKSCQLSGDYSTCECLPKPPTVAPASPSPVFTQNCLVISCTSQPDYCLDPNKLPIAKDIRKGEKTRKYYGSSDDCIHGRNGMDVHFGPGLCECRDAASCEPRSCGDAGICKNGKQPRDPSKPIYYNISKKTWHLTQDFCNKEEGGAKDAESKCDCETPKVSKTCPNGWRCPEGIGGKCSDSEKTHEEAKCDLWVGGIKVAERACCEENTTTVLDAKEETSYIDCPESSDQHCYSQSSCPTYSGLTEEVGRPCKPDSLDPEGVCCKKPTTISSFTSSVTASYTDVLYSEPQGFVAGGGGGTCKAIIVNGVPVACVTNL